MAAEVTTTGELSLGQHKGGRGRLKEVVAK